MCNTVGICENSWDPNFQKCHSPKKRSRSSNQALSTVWEINPNISQSVWKEDALAPERYEKMYYPLDLLQMPQPSATACGKHTFLSFTGTYDYEELWILSVKQINLWYALFVVYLSLSSVLWKDLLLEGRGSGGELCWAFQRRRHVQKCLRSSQHEQQGLAPGKGHRCLSEHAIVQYLHTV